MAPHRGVTIVEHDRRRLQQPPSGVAPAVVRRRFVICPQESDPYAIPPAPHHLAFDDYDDFTEYLLANAHAGDAIDIWNLHSLLRVDNALIRAKCAAEDGTVPKGGAY